MKSIFNRGHARRYVASGGKLPAHYVWGDMRRGEWGRYGYRPVDHHLRQFGS